MNAANIDSPWPPEPGELTSFPTRTLKKQRPIHRLHARELNPFWFSSTAADADGGNRFDLALPDGASYWALEPAVAILETLARRPIRMIPLEVVDRYALTTSLLPRELKRLANLPVKAARRFGLTAEIYTTAERRFTRAWARALHAAGFTGVLALPRHDVTGRHRTLTLWDKRGEHPPYGWDWSAQTGPVPSVVHDELATWGIRIVPVPFEVATIEPPDLP